MYPIGWNINGLALAERFKQNHFAGLVEHHQRLKPAATLIMDHFGLAQQLQAAVPEMTVISRSWSGEEGSEWQSKSPEKFIEEWKRDGDRNIVRYTTNEPSYGSHNFQEFVAHEVELMRLARQNDFTIVAFNSSVGNYEYEWVERGWFDPLLRAAVQYGHYLGCHEYYTVSLPASFYGVEQLLDKNWMRDRNNWKSRTEFFAEVEASPNPSYWYLFRHVWLVNRMKAIGIPDEALKGRFILTEFGYDDIRNNQQHVRDTIDRLKAAYGIAKYHDDMRGVMSYQRLHDDYWGSQQTYAQRIADELDWYVQLKPDWIKGVLLFTLNTNWSRPHAHDWQDLPEIFPLLEAQSAAHSTPTTQPMRRQPPSLTATPRPKPLPLTYKRVQARMRSASTLRVRTTPQMRDDNLKPEFVLTQEWRDIWISREVVRSRSGIYHDETVINRMSGAPLPLMIRQQVEQYTSSLRHIST